MFSKLIRSFLKKVKNAKLNLNLSPKDGTAFYEEFFWFIFSAFYEIYYNS